VVDKWFAVWLECLVCCCVVARVLLGYLGGCQCVVGWLECLACCYVVADVLLGYFGGC